MNRLVSLPSAIQDKIVESLNTLTVSEPLLHYLLFSPIRILELPDEILSVIFLEFILSSPWPIDSPYSRQFKVLTLTWTCSRFRNICISVPQLWAFHYIPPNESMSGRITSPAFYAKLEDYTRLALSYSKNGPLHIRIYNPKASAADLLFAASARWKSAHITRAGQVSDYIGFGFLPKHVNGQHPLFLESLSLESDNFYPLLSLVYSPTLRNLHVIDMILQLPVPQVNDSHRKSQIRNISGSASLPVLYTFLELCPKIEQLGVVQKPYPSLVIPASTTGAQYGQIYTSSNRIALIDAMHLQSLSLCAAVNQPLLTSWLGFTPSLVSLSLNGDQFTEKATHEQIVRDLIAFLGRSSCRLEKFAISHVEISDPDRLVELFTLMPALKALEFGKCLSWVGYLSVLRDPDSAIIRRLKAPGSKHETHQVHPVLLPCLEQFGLYLRVAPAAAIFEGLLDVLESRRMRTAQLNDDDTSLDECGVAYLNEIEFTGNLHMMPEVSVYGHRVRKLMGLDSASKRAWFNNGLADIIGV